MRSIQLQLYRPRGHDTDPKAEASLTSWAIPQYVFATESSNHYGSLHFKQRSFRTCLWEPVSETAWKYNDWENNFSTLLKIKLFGTFLLLGDAKVFQGQEK